MQCMSVKIIQFKYFIDIICMSIYVCVGAHVTCGGQRIIPYVLSMFIV